MIAHEIQLGYVIRGKIQSETKSRLRQNPSKIFLSEKILLEKIIVSKNICVGCCLRFPVRKVSCLGQIDAYHH